MLDGLIETSADGYFWRGHGFSDTLGAQTRIEDIWIRGTGAGIWAGSERALTEFPDISKEDAQAKGSLFQNLRIRETFADGINLCNGKVDVTVRNINARDNGDDAFAMWSYEPGGVNNPVGNQNNTFQNCTAELTNFAHGFALFGGRDNQFIDLVVRDNIFGFPGVRVSMGFPPQNPMRGDNRFERVTVTRCGWASTMLVSNYPPHASISIDGSMGPVRSLSFKDIDVRDADFIAVRIRGDVEAGFENVNISGWCTGSNSTDWRSSAVFYEVASGTVWWKNRTISGGGHGHPEERRYNSAGLNVVTLTGRQFIPKTARNIDTAEDWAHNGINEAYTKGFIPDNLQNHYTEFITRAEFCRMAMSWLRYATGLTTAELAAAYGHPDRLNRTFSDTSDPDVMAAYVLDITSGVNAPTATTPGRFDPGGRFSRQMAATMVRNMFRSLGVDTTNPPDFGFLDILTAEPWARDAINFCAAKEVVRGRAGTPPHFDPLTNFRRQESIVLFNNIGPDILWER
jgi:hypothetical protein